MTPGWSPLVVAFWISATAGEPESYLGARTALPQFGGEEDAFSSSPGVGGLEVVVVIENSPAQHAGLLAGDVLVRLNGVAIRSPRHLESVVRELPVGAGLVLEILRGERVLELASSTVARLVPLPEPDARGWLDRRHFGIVVEDVAGAPIAVGSDRSAVAQGARIRQFLPGSVAPGAGLAKGDVLMVLDGKPIQGGEDFLVLLRDLEPGQKVKLQIQREDREIHLVARTRHAGSYVTTFFFPLIVDYERDKAKDKVEFGLLPFNLFKYERHEERTTWRLLWVIEFGTGSNEDLEELE